tara:strand:+ start:1657 stop:1920 length:264 start_codon:yes stop_codon:yes gene_type:complete
MFKRLKQDKKIKNNSFKEQKVSNNYSLENENKDELSKLNYSKPPPKKKMPKNDEIFGTTAVKKKKKKISKTKKASTLGKPLYKQIKF